MELNIDWTWWQTTLFAVAIILTSRIRAKDALGILKKALRRWLDDD